MITTDVQYCGRSILVSIDGRLEGNAGRAFDLALDDVSPDVRVLMVDLHGMAFMDGDGLLQLLELHRRAEGLGLRVLIVGWQPQPQQLVADMAGIPGAGSAPGERFTLAGFRLLAEERA
ncbi:STAS domain-containing protein [Streptomyces vinaceus]|uniref:STAS domain-containing protein n=1 Tax=Streptomyces vinaceus TaxID=1960 RepID=UPI00368FD86E